MTIKNVMETDCLDIDEILLSSPKKSKDKKQPRKLVLTGGA